MTDDRARLFAELQQSERLYRTLVDNSRDGVFLIQHGIIVFCNEALARPLGFSASELIGTDYAARVAPEDLRAQEQRRPAREGGSTDLQAYEVRLLSKDGTPRLFEVRAGAVEYLGEPASIGTIRDVTELRAQEAQLVAAEEHYRLALWASGDRLFDWDCAAGMLTPVATDSAAAATRSLLVPSVDSLAPYVHPDDLPAFRDAIQRHIDGASDFFEASYRLRNRHGEWRWKLARGKVVARADDGRPLRISGTQRDISRIKAVENELLALTQELDARVQQRTRELQDERRDLENANRRLAQTVEELRRTQSELIESEKMASLGRLVAGVAHEVNTPLGVAMTAQSFLRDELAALKATPTPERVAAIASAAAMIETNLGRAAQLVRSFKQVAVDQSANDIRRIELRDYLEGILRSLHPKLKQTPHEVVVECDPKLEVTTRPDALYQIVSNLVLNSLLHAYPDGRAGRLLIHAESDGETLRLRYEDDGAGMDATVAARVYEPFFTTRRERGGTGLGMHVVYNLVTQALGGRIALTTAPGQGVRFEITAPARHPASAAPAAPP
jgi:PAS domain S-box-containing protein